MTNDIYGDDTRGFRMMIQLAVGGVVLLVVGLVLPSALSAFLGSSGSPGATTSFDSAAWVAVALGAGLLVLAGLVGMLHGPFRTLQRKYGTLSALLMVTPGLLLGGAVIATAFL